MSFLLVTWTLRYFIWRTKLASQWDNCGLWHFYDHAEGEIAIIEIYWLRGVVWMNWCVTTTPMETDHGKIFFTLEVWSQDLKLCRPALYPLGQDVVIVSRKYSWISCFCVDFTAMMRSWPRTRLIDIAMKISVLRADALLKFCALG